MSVYRNRPKHSSERAKWFVALCILVMVIVLTS